MARIERNFSDRDAQEQRWLVENTWCDSCANADSVNKMQKLSGIPGRIASHVPSNPTLKFAPVGRWDAPSARPLAARWAAW